MPKSKRRNIFFTADLHFNHANIIEHCDRPFKDVHEMNMKLIENWNNQVKPNDIVYVLGDFVWNTTPKKEICQLISDLNGELHMVIGNHDKLTVQQCLRLGFTSACYGMILKIAGEYVNLSHYPYHPSWWRDLKIGWKNRLLFGIWDRLKHRSKRPKDDGKYLIHGHTHQKDFIRGKTFHVGVDAHKFKLVPIGKIESEIAKRKK